MRSGLMFPGGIRSSCSLPRLGGLLSSSTNLGRCSGLRRFVSLTPTCVHERRFVVPDRSGRVERSLRLGESHGESPTALLIHPSLRPRTTMPSSSLPSSSLSLLSSSCSSMANRSLRSVFMSSNSSLTDSKRTTTATTYKKKMTDARALGEDIHSFSNFSEIRTERLDLNLKVNFDRKAFYGHVDHSLVVLKEGVQHVQFDAKNISIEDVNLVSCEGKETPLSWTLPDHHQSLGHCLRVKLPANLKAQDKLRVRVYYSTTWKSGGIQWFEPEQTEGGKQPYVYTQCQAILSRTLLPCMDTPAVKAPYGLSLSVPTPLVAVASGHLVEVKTQGDYSTYNFNQKLPIPAYLIAIAVGALKSKKVGPRSSVWTEEESLEKAAFEFGEHTEEFIKAGERIIGIPYEWGIYDLLVLPAAFPYGGMENPSITFVSSSLLAGDRSLVDVVAHEIAHSWSGNLATNSSWKDFWLNEGFTMYIERLILGEIEKSDEYRRFQILLGYKELVRVVADLLATDPEFTKLQPNLLGVDPDDAFSIVPYEKGCLFLYYLETRVAGNKEAMKEWLHELYTDFKAKSYSSAEMREHFVKHFTAKGKEKELAAVDWTVWLTGEGLPPFDPSTELVNDFSKVPIALAEKWVAYTPGKDVAFPLSAEEFKQFKPAQVMLFLDELLTSSAMPHPQAKVTELEEKLSFTTSKNVEIAYRGMLLVIKCGLKEMIPFVGAFLGTVGRGRYVKPLYKALDQLDHAAAVKIYQSHKSRYHSVIRNMFDAALEA